LRRHRLLVAIGFAFALALALLSYVRVSADGLTYRSPEVWSNEATLILSDASRSEFRRTLPPTVDPNRLPGLVDQYAEIATSDPVMRLLIKQRLISRRPEAKKSDPAAVTATSVASPINGAITPILKITGMATSPLAATRLTIRATDAFIDVAQAQQVQARIPKSQRVELRILKRAGVPKLVGPRSKTTFIIILLAGLTVTVAAAFIRDNFQRSARQERQPDVFDRLVLEAQPPASAGSDPMGAAADYGGRGSGANPEGGDPETPPVIHTRRRARSSG
jgi:capsular polysaccharide biosynthesis protein